MSTTVEVLERMKEVLMERGWTQNRLINHFGQVCLAGAHNVAVYGNAVNREGACRLDVIAAINDQALSRGFDHGPDFNDRSDRTFNQVIDFIDEVILVEKMKVS